MKLHIETIRQFLHRVKLDPPLHDIITEAERLDWNKANSSDPKRYYIRYKEIDGTRFPALHSAMTYLQEEAKQLILDVMYSDDQFISQWKMERDRMDAVTILKIEISKDLPGFQTPLHVDVRRSVTNGMIYLSDRDDEQLSTFFYEDRSRSNPVRIPTDYCTGWLMANMENVWHEGHNKTDRNRYCIRYEIMLDI
jgi:hypothetical protein